jgi:AraC-like DNA-binding protein
VGAYVQGRTYVYWCFDEALWGLAAWGYPREDDLASLLDIFREEHRRGIGPYASLVDFSRLEAIDPAAFGLWAAYVDENRALQAKRLLREAVDRPSEGLVASVLAGYEQVLSPMHPLRVFTDACEALGWIGRDDALQVLTLVDDAIGSGMGGDVVARLRELFRRQPMGVDEAARRLGMSPRSLQRALRLSGTSFQKESVAERIQVAKRLLLETDGKLSSIAHEAGFSNQQHFTRIFTQLTGEPPGAWRTGARRKSGEMKRVAGVG